MVLFICIWCYLLFAGFGVRRLHVVLSGLRIWLVVCVHVCIFVEKQIY